MKFKTRLAVASSKTSKKGMNLLGRKGTHLPGKIARKIDNKLIENVAKPRFNIAVTGTNGKTTTSNMIADIVKDLGFSYTSNRLGSNTYYGIASALLDGNKFFAGNKVDFGVFEVDELWSNPILRELRPDSLTVTNLFQDSFERNANIFYIKGKIEKAIPEGLKLILNADDSISAYISPENPRVYFSVDNIFNEAPVEESKVEDLIYCPNCGEKIVWDFKRYHHIGSYHCKTCSFKNPIAKYRVKSYDKDSKTLVIEVDGLSLSLPIIQDSIEGVYNQIAAYASLRENGFNHEEVARSMGKIRVVNSRFNTHNIANKTIYNMVAKGYNPVANTRVFDFIRKNGNRPKTILYIFDNPESGDSIDKRTPGWINAINFDLLKENLNKLIFKSRHGNELVLSALMDGLDREKIIQIDDFSELGKYLDRNLEEDVYILHDIEDPSLVQAEDAFNSIKNFLEGK